MEPPFVDEVVWLIERFVEIEQSATAIMDFLSGLCAASHPWTLLLLELDSLRHRVSHSCFASDPHLSANALRLLCQFWDCELRTPSPAIEHVLHFIMPFASMTKRHALEVITALRIVISTPHFCDAHGSVVLTCDIMSNIIGFHPSRRVRTEILGLYAHMISQRVDDSFFLRHCFFQTFVLQLNVAAEGAEYKFPPVVLTFITDGLRKTAPVKQQEILAKLDPGLLFTGLTSSDAQIREEFIAAVTLFILWRQVPWDFFYQPPVFAQIATFFIASECRLKVLGLKFCHALVVTNAVNALALFDGNTEIQSELYAFFHGEEQDPEAIGLYDEVTRETRPFPWDVMGGYYQLQWICDLTNLGGEPAAYCLDTVLLLIHADTQILERQDFVAQLGTYEDFINDLSDIADMEDQPPYVLADGIREVVLPECAQMILTILRDAPS
jgi:hypothetical protein